MRPIKILTDSCSDMPKEYREKYDVDYIRYSVFTDGKEIMADLDYATLSSKEFFNDLRDGKKYYPLSATEYEIKTRMKIYLEMGYDILYIAGRIKQSSSLAKAAKVADELTIDYQDAKIETIDSLNISFGISLLVFKACQLRDEGKEIEEIKDEVEQLRNHVIQYTTVDTLSYLAANKRIDARGASLGDFLKLRPILISDANGVQTVIEKINNQEECLKEMINLFVENVTNPEEQEVFIIYGDDYNTAFEVKQMLNESKVKFKKITTLTCSPLVGVCFGPGLISLFGMGKEVTYTEK